MIDLAQLDKVARRDGETCVVSRRWLRQVHAELLQARGVEARQFPLMELDHLLPAHKG